MEAYEAYKLTKQADDDGSIGNIAMGVGAGGLGVHLFNQHRLAQADKAPAAVATPAVAEAAEAAVKGKGAVGKLAEFAAHYGGKGLAGAVLAGGAALLHNTAVGKAVAEGADTVMDAAKDHLTDKANQAAHMVTNKVRAFQGKKEMPWYNAHQSLKPRTPFVSAPKPGQGPLPQVGTKPIDNLKPVSIKIDPTKARFSGKGTSTLRNTPAAINRQAPGDESKKPLSHLLYNDKLDMDKFRRKTSAILEKTALAIFGTADISLIDLNNAHQMKVACMIVDAERHDAMQAYLNAPLWEKAAAESNMSDVVADCEFMGAVFGHLEKVANDLMLYEQMHGAKPSSGNVIQDALGHTRSL